jgi:twinkle protein
MRAVEIHNLLAAQVESVARYLLPNGRKIGHEWRVGGIDGEAGKSMGVHLGAGKPGVWMDGESGESGDLIGLWMATRNLSLREACREALEFLGIRDDRPEHHPRQYRKPDRDGVSRLNADHAAWLRDVRKLPDESVEAYKLASRGDRLMFPYLRDGELVFAKYRRLPKQFSAEAECEPILFGWQAIPNHARAIAICEGELDAIAWHAYRIPALSVPTGAGAHKWIEGEFDRLSVFDSIFLSMDMDAAGQKSVAELVERLGRERVRVVKLPHKDANECLMQGVPRETILQCIRDSRTLDPSELRNAAEYEDAIVAEIHRVDEGMQLPWKKTHESILLRPGETSIWAGTNGHGKTALVSHVVGYLASNGYRCCVASMEWRTPLWLMRMARQIAGSGNPTEAYLRHIIQTFRETLWAFDVAGSAKAERIIEVFQYARRRYQIELFVIDNLTKCGFADDDYPGQKKFVEALADFARINDCHVAIVAHMRKGESEDHPSGKMGVKGSGGITDMVATVFEVWRNKAREKAIVVARETGEPLPDKNQPDGPCGADTMLICLKQNATGKEPAVRLWFDPSSTQFLAKHDHHPRPMTPFSVAGIETEDAA